MVGEETVMIDTKNDDDDEISYPEAESDSEWILPGSGGVYLSDDENDDDLFQIPDHQKIDSIAVSSNDMNTENSKTIGLNGKYIFVPEGTNFKYYLEEKGKDKTVEEEQKYLEIIDERKKGLSFQIWPSSIALATYAQAIERFEPGYWKGKTVLELGAGCGIVGLVFASLGANVVITDLPMVIPLLKQNIDLNKSLIEGDQGSAVAKALSWGTPAGADFFENGNATPDIIVAADVIYHKPLFGILLSTIMEMLPKDKPDAYLLLAHIRRFNSDTKFFQKARKHFDVEDITDYKEKLEKLKRGEQEEDDGIKKYFATRKREQQIFKIKRRIKKTIL